MFSGATGSKVLRVLRHMRVVCTCTRIFFRHQLNILIPAVNNIWMEHQHWNTAMLQTEGRDLVFGGDGRSDIPGYSAKYGSYRMTDLEANCVFYVWLLQSNECCGSYHMEKEGLSRSIQFLQDAGLITSRFITDRHRQIAWWLADTKLQASLRYLARGKRSEEEASVNL